MIQKNEMIHYSISYGPLFINDTQHATYIHTYIHTSPASPERLALSLEHVDHDDLVDVDARVRVELGHVRACVSSLSS